MSNNESLKQQLKDLQAEYIVLYFQKQALQEQVKSLTHSFKNINNMVKIVNESVILLEVQK